MFAGDSGGPFPDITRMSINPKQRTSKPNHTRAQSESYLHFPDDLLLLDDSEIDLFDSTSASPMLPPNQNPYARHRSLSVDDDFFDDLGISYQGKIEAEGSKLPNDDDDDDGDDGVSGGGVKTHRRRHSFSIDASAHGMFDGIEFESGGVDCVKKAMTSEKLTHMALIDPKKVKRILANRQSAARSKERKIRYTSELERKVQTLQTEATTLSAQVTLLQRDTSGLTCENKELKLRLQAMEQQAHLKEALNDTLKNEVYRLRIETGQIPASNGHSIYRPSLQYTQSSSHFYGAHQSLQSHPQTQQPKSSSNSNNQNPNQSVQTSFMDYSN